MEALKFVLGDFWHFVGALVFVGVSCAGIAQVVLAFRGVAT